MATQIFFDYILNQLRLKDFLESSYKGYYLTLASLQSAYPVGVAGDFATVRNPTGIDYIYIWDADTSAWEQTGGTAGSIWGSVTGDINTQTDLMLLLAGKQDVLQSGVTIKTLNGIGLLGSGDMSIPPFVWGSTITAGTGTGVTINTGGTAGEIYGLTVTGTGAKGSGGSLDSGLININYNASANSFKNGLSIRFHNPWTAANLTDNLYGSEVGVGMYIANLSWGWRSNLLLERKSSTDYCMPLLSVRIGNTQAQAHTLATFDAGSSNQQHTWILIKTLYGTALQIDFSTGQAKGIYFTDTYNPDTANRYCISASFGSSRRFSLVNFYNNISIHKIFWGYGQLSGNDNVADDVAFETNCPRTAQLTTDRTTNFFSVIMGRTNTRTSGTTTDNYNFAYFKRSSIQNGSGGTFSASGTVMKLENVATQSAGTIVDTVSCLSLVQSNNSKGGHILFNNYVPNTEPTVEGTLWHDGRSTYIYAGAKLGISQTIFSQTSSVTCENTTIETSLIGAGVGTTNLPLNTLKPGRVLRIKSKGYISYIASQNSTLRVKVGWATNIVSVGALPSTASLAYIEIELDIICKTSGASGTLWIEGRSLIGVGAGVGNISARAIMLSPLVPVGVNTTIANLIDITYQWETANTWNSLVIQSCTAELLW